MQNHLHKLTILLILTTTFLPIAQAINYGDHREFMINFQPRYGTEFQGQAVIDLIAIEYTNVNNPGTNLTNVGTNLTSPGVYTYVVEQNITLGTIYVRPLAHTRMDFANTHAETTHFWSYSFSVSSLQGRQLLSVGACVHHAINATPTVADTTFMGNCDSIPYSTIQAAIVPFESQAHANNTWVSRIWLNNSMIENSTISNLTAGNFSLMSNLTIQTSWDQYAATLPWLILAIFMLYEVAWLPAIACFLNIGSSLFSPALYPFPAAMMLFIIALALHVMVLRGLIPAKWGKRGDIMEER